MNIKAIDDLHTVLEADGITCRRSVDLSVNTYMETGGTAELLVEPKTVAQLVAVLEQCGASGVPFLLIGATSNVLFLDSVPYGVLICTVGLQRAWVEDAFLVAEAGLMLGELSRLALRHGVTGFEGLEGIPGTVGGAVFMNAGAYGSEIKQILYDVDLYDPERGIHRESAEELMLGYRSSRLQQERHRIVLQARFRMQPGDVDSIYGQMELYHAKRHKYQEFCYPNLGSLFAGDVYYALGRQSRRFRILYGVYARLAYRYKLLGRESPINRRWLHQWIMKWFGLEVYRDCFSVKNLNCLVNTGQGTAKMLAFIEQMQVLTGHRLRVENEIMQPPKSSR